MSLEVDGITVRFGGLTALDDVSLTAAPGEVVGVIGPNGAGKTTLFNAICGFVTPDEGSIRWEGDRLDGTRTSKLAGRGVARTLQALELFEGLTAAENVMIGAGVHGKAGWLSAALGIGRSDKDEAALRERAVAALEQAGAAGIADRFPGTLPYPTQKRVALARALVAEPRLLLLDEPAGGLGADDMEELVTRIGELRGRDLAIVLVEHHMDVVMRVCDRVVVLDFGKRICTGTPAEVQADQAVLDAYLGVEVDAAR